MHRQSKAVKETVEAVSFTASSLVSRGQPSRAQNP